MALFTSPEISRLPLTEVSIGPGEEPKKRWWLFIAIIILLLIIGLGVYIVLQEWYKRRYEDYLFKKRNDLYNLVIFIQASRDKKIKDSVIAAKLRKVGWSSEQVTYAMKTHSEKRTGMLEVPVGWILSFFEKEQPSTSMSQGRVLSSRNFKNLPK